MKRHAIALVLSWSALAWAGDEKRADALFDEGLALLDAGKIAEGCAKLEESRAIADGVGVTLYLADCEEKLGHFVRSRALFESGVSLAHARKDSRETAARARIDALDAKIPMLRVESSTPVEVDGEKGDWSKARPIDPGKHMVRLADGTWQREIDTPAQRTDVVIVVPVREETPSAPTENKSATISPLRIASVATVGVGAILFFSSFAMGADAISKKNASNDMGHCDAMNRCDAAGLALRNSADGSATASTVLFFTSLLVMGAGTVLWFVAPKIAPSPTHVAFRF